MCGNFMKRAIEDDVWLCQVNEFFKCFKHNVSFFFKNIKKISKITIKNFDEKDYSKIKELYNFRVYAG